MTLRLILTRHAKSNWDDPALSDHERPLNPRGQRDAPRVGAWLQDHGYCPDRALVSSARRAQETWERLSSAFGANLAMTTLPALYHAEPEVILAKLQAQGAGTIMVIGHNPGIGAFAQRILGARIAHPRFLDYPTCATLVASFAVGDWSQINWGSGRAIDFIVPRDL